MLALTLGPLRRILRPGGLMELDGIKDSGEADSAAGEVGALQFEQAEFEEGAASGSTCSLCEADLEGEYFLLNESASCRNCTEAFKQQLDSGTTGQRVRKSLMLGIPAAILGAGLYYGIVAITGYELGLVAILIGFMVGAAVKAGAGLRAGRGFQFLAAGLTYVAIVSTYVPFIIEGFEEAAQSETEAAQVRGETLAEPPPASAGELMVGVALLVLFILAVPFLGGFENILGILIIGFGVYQAWRMNARVDIQITGPHRATQPEPASV